jgi:hypothetical protein
MKRKWKADANGILSVSLYNNGDYMSLVVDKDYGGDCWQKFWRLTGTAAALAAEVNRFRTPEGILLDRLQEVPEECVAPPELVAAAVNWLRNHPPTWFPPASIVGEG